MITAQMATYPARLPILAQAINSILPQVDKLNVMLNGYNMIPSCCKHPKIETHYLDNSMTDAAKFYGIENLRGYILTCDDDIIYKPGYVAKMIEGVERHNRKYVVTIHGRVFQPLPIKSFYRSRAEMYQCRAAVIGDHIIDCGGDGVMCWHSDTIKLNYSEWELPNMSQTFMALACNKRGVQQMLIEHEEDWIDYLYPEDYDTTIWDRENENDQVQTMLINERWITR